jgi:hypothetical protein
MALGTIHVLAEGRPSTTLVMCPSHITHKWAREILLTIPRARAFLIEDMRNSGEPHAGGSLCEGARAGRRRQRGTAAGKALPGICDLHGRERRHVAIGGSAAAAGHSRRSPPVVHCHR